MSDTDSKYCPICGKEKEYPGKPLCYDCWAKDKRRCQNCGKVVERPDYFLCNKCYRKKYN